MKSIIVIISAAVFLGGCATKPPPGVPDGSMIVAEGDSVLQFSAKTAGTVVLRDVKQNRPVFMTQVKATDEVIVNIGARRATVAGKTLDLPITPGPHELYFKPASEPAKPPGY